MKIRRAKRAVGHLERSLLTVMSATQARAFLLKPESYCSIDLPIYFTFAPVLSAVSKELGCPVEVFLACHPSLGITKM